MDTTQAIWSKSIPDEILLKIFNYCSVDFKLLLRIAAVCREWRRVVREDILWKAHSLHMRIHNKTWYEKVVYLKERRQLKIRKLIIDKFKSLFVLFDDNKSSLYRLSRKGNLSLHHQFEKLVTSSEAASFLGGTFDNSSNPTFRLSVKTTQGVWCGSGHRGGNHYTPAAHQHYFQIFDENNQVAETLPLIVDSLTHIECCKKIEKFGDYILTCGLDGNFVGDGFNDYLKPNVVWKINENTDEVFSNHQYCLEPILQLRLSKKAILIDGLFIDIIDQKEIKMIDLCENPLSHKPKSSCVIS